MSETRNGKRGAFKVPFGTISIPEQTKRMIADLLESRRLSSGRYVREFEKRFADLLQVEEAVAVSSGTDADVLALSVLHDYGAHRGDEVIVPALSFVATGSAVVHAGFRPVFVDIERETLNIDTRLIEGAITQKTRAILPVHLMGKPADMDAITAIAKRHKLFVIEDAAEAHGAFYKDRPVGGIGDMGAFSLYLAHIISTCEGGIVVTHNEEYAGILRSLRSHGRACKCRICILNTTPDRCPNRFKNIEDRRFTNERIGYSCKMNELEAAIGLGNLDLYEEILEKRRRNLFHILDRFEEFHPFLSTMREGPGERIGPMAIPIIVQEGAPFTRAELTSFLEERGIETRPLFSSIPTQCRGFEYMGYRLGQFPKAEYVGTHGVHIGVHQDLGEAEMDYVLETLRELLRRYGFRGTEGAG
ncbi:MAG: DegT/DnrJ/EryC1/StrS family aminotransferase [Candidatus Aureabacteria bacterium]|nr:DegT/DnrJ/EryC1/StrS family aminotransferase [Candidatus Auribacterota bacterium]